ncbi:MAG TPA: GGDEF domain-containing protein, partial [Bryobacteraceae bacterium]|nr:GGDEF domain-containing protein [Bryobacteraceae bacterium]
AGDFSPCLGEPRVRVISAGTLPQPKRPIFDQYLATREDGQWTELRGIVRSGEIKGGRLFLNVAAAGGNFVAITPRYRGDWKETLVDSIVVVTGVVAPIRNEQRQAVGVRMFVPGAEYIHIEQAAPRNPFDTPLTDATSVGRFRPAADFERRIRVRATVAATSPGVFYVTDGQASLAVQEQSPCNLRPGDVADFVGFPGPVFSRPGIQDALCRKVSSGSSPAAVSVTADAILPEENFTDPSGVGHAAATRFDMKLIRTEGTLMQVSRNPNGYVLILQSGKQQFAATVPDSAKSAIGRLGNGDQLRLTGVCLVTYDPYHRGQSFHLLLRSGDDIQVTASPPWWDVRRAMWGLGLMAGVLLLSGGWITILRRQVRGRTRELLEANETLRRLSCEDPLTGAANRREFDLVLQSEFDGAARSRTALSLLLIDIDFFKALNDQHGHLYGDECLARVASALRSVVKAPAGCVARYGGEEFAAILPETDANEARAVAESMRAAVTNLAIPNAGDNGQPYLSVSVGVATCYPHKTETGEGLSAQTLVGLADRALYQAKAGGRNRCVSLENASIPAPAQAPPTIRPVY